MLFPSDETPAPLRPPQIFEPTRITLMNPGGGGCTRATEVAISLADPKSTLAYLEFHEDGNPIPMAAGLVQKVGVESHIYVVFMNWRPGQTVAHGKLVAPAVQPAKLPAFRPHPAVADKLEDVIVRFPGETNSKLELVESNTARQVWKRTFQARELWGTQWYYLYNSQREVRFSMLLTADCPAQPLKVLRNPAEMLTCGELFVIENEHLERGNVTLPHSGAWRCWGRIACGFSATDEQDDDIADIMAGPVYGGPREWVGRYMNWYIPDTSALPAVQPELARYREDLKVGAERQFMAPRPLGLMPLAGGTGRQEDFGLTKGTAVFQGNPDYIGLMRHSFMDCVRGGDYRLEDGSLLKAEGHPRWRTWSGKTHVNSEDKLGVPTEIFYRSDYAGPLSTNGQRWVGIDDQHRSQNNAIALAILTGDHLVLHTLERYLNMDIAMFPDRPGAPRAIGRLADCWAKMLRVLGGKSELRLQAILKPKVRQWEANLHYHREQDPQLKAAEVKTDSRMGIYRPEDGWTKPQPAMSVWEHGLLLVGAESLSGVYLADRRPLKKLADDVYDTLFKYCTNVTTLPGRQIRVASTRYYPPGGREMPLEDWMVLDSAGAGVHIWVDAGMNAVKPFTPYQTPQTDLERAEWFCATPIK